MDRESSEKRKILDRDEGITCDEHALHKLDRNLHKIKEIIKEKEKPTDLKPKGNSRRQEMKSRKILYLKKVQQQIQQNFCLMSTDHILPSNR